VGVVVVDASRGGVSIFAISFEIDDLILADATLVIQLLNIVIDEACNGPADIQYFFQFFTVFHLIREGQAVGREGTVLRHHQIHVLVLLLHLLI
jgi:hypothetical protein